MGAKITLLWRFGNNQIGRAPLRGGRPDGRT
jgi:hypothetical protein